MPVDLSFIGIVLNASFIVQLVMCVLMLVSFVSWTIIFEKWYSLRVACRRADKFEAEFWSTTDLGVLFNKVMRAPYTLIGMEKLFEGGFKEFAKLQGSETITPQAIIDGSQRAMRVVMIKEITTLETNLSFLATVGSTSPYVGLFGTVWGIMHSFHALGSVKQATIAMVAPGISEALIATAMGLFAAIPAVIAYNRYINDVERLVSRYDTFVEEFSAILHRYTHTK